MFTIFVAFFVHRICKIQITLSIFTVSEVNPALAGAIKPKTTRKRKEVEIQQEPTVEVEAQVEPLPF